MQPQAPGMPGANSPDLGKIKNAKLLRGCGGCGCVFALVVLIGGAILIGFGSQRATQEAMPFGIITTGLALPIAVIAAVLLFVGISNLKKAGGRGGVHQRSTRQPRWLARRRRRASGFTTMGSSTCSSSGRSVMLSE